MTDIELIDALRFVEGLLDADDRDLAAKQVHEATERLTVLAELFCATPKTADGVPIYPQMKVWHPSSGYVAGPWMILAMHSTCADVRQSEGVVTLRSYDELFANREAAEEQVIA